MLRLPTRESSRVLLIGNVISFSHYQEVNVQRAAKYQVSEFRQDYHMDICLAE